MRFIVGSTWVILTYYPPMDNIDVTRRYKYFLMTFNAFMKLKISNDQCLLSYWLVFFLGKNWKYMPCNQLTYQIQTVMNLFKIIISKFFLSIHLINKCHFCTHWELSFFFLCFFSLYPAVDLRINDENRSEKERIYRLNQESFGNGPQPKLDFAQYKVVKATSFVLFCFFL